VKDQTALAQRLTACWYSNNIFILCLLPLSWVYLLVIRIRRLMFRIGLLKVSHLSVPVIVVGNISVGGTGKTPLIIWLADCLKKSGYKPGIISKGYGGSAKQWPQWVDASSDPSLVGDEALLIAKQTTCPVSVGPIRVDTANFLLNKTDCDVILSDDGLQHYALDRDIEIAVIDGMRRFGNGYCLPAGPLREPKNRLQNVDIIICNGGRAGDNEFPMRLEGSIAINLATAEQRPLTHFVGQHCHACAGIGNPQRFFDLLAAVGLNCITHSFPDHYHYLPEDIEFNDGKPVLMTAKDAVKCMSFALDNYWFVPVSAKLDVEFSKRLLKLVKEKTNN
jgi:tetraacyldisaccharide 4'-kinase